MSLIIMWKHFLKRIISAFDLFGITTIEEPKTLHDDWKAIQDDWRFLVDDADIFESLYKEIENEKK